MTPAAPDRLGGGDRSVGLLVQRRGGRDARRRLGGASRWCAIDRRVGLIFVAFLSLLAVAVVRAVYLGVVRADSLQQAAVSQQITNVPIPATRGAITDRNGVELALSESAADVIADPYLIRRGHPMLMAQTMAPLLHMPVLKVLTAITKPHTGYVVVAQEVTPATAQAILALKFDGKPINGITSIPDVKRVYPRDWTAAQVLGGVYEPQAPATPAWSTEYN